MPPRYRNDAGWSHVAAAAQKSSVRDGAVAQNRRRMRLGPLSLRADARGRRTLEMLLVSQQAGAIRGIPPLLFQALCDIIGLLGQTLFDRHIA